jgi:dTDP-4-amino-4,6-dideoxygalactose transaminase
MSDPHGVKRVSHSNPKLGYLSQREEIDDAIRRVLEGGRYILGDEVATFEAEFARYLGASHCVGTGSGTDAIHLALRALGIGPTDAVITAANTATATVAAIELAGAQPLVCDIEPESFTLSPDHLKQLLARTKAAHVRAVIPVHLYGHPAPMPAIVAIAAEHGLKIIEDCAQANGAEIDGRKVGTWGDAAAFSFYPTKNLGAFGDGGALVTNDVTLAGRARELRLYGWKERYVSEEPGLNTRLDELQAAILRVRLRRLDAENERRRQIADRYDSLLVGSGVATPAVHSGMRHVYHQYVIHCAGRDDLRVNLERAGIETAVLYPEPIHQQPAYRGRVGVTHPLTAAEESCRTLLCLPMHPWLEDEEIARTTGAIIAWSQRAR